MQLNVVMTALALLFKVQVRVVCFAGKFVMTVQL